MRGILVCASAARLQIAILLRAVQDSVRGASAQGRLEMKYPACVCFGWSLLTVALIPASVGEMYTSLLNVKQAISVERKLIDHLRTYIDHEVERLEDIKR